MGWNTSCLDLSQLLLLASSLLLLLLLLYIFFFVFFVFFFFFFFFPVHFFSSCALPLFPLSHTSSLITSSSSFFRYVSLGLLPPVRLDLSFKQLLPLLVWLSRCKISHVCSPPHCRADPGSVQAGGNMLLQASFYSMWLCLTVNSVQCVCVWVGANQEVVTHHTPWETDARISECVFSNFCGSVCLPLKSLYNRVCVCVCVCVCVLHYSCTV